MAKQIHAVARRQFTPQAPFSSMLILKIELFLHEILYHHHIRLFFLGSVACGVLPVTAETIPVNEGHHLRPCAGLCRRKRCLARPFCNPVLHCPQDGVVIEFPLCHIPERTACILRFRRSGCAPQECDDLRPRTRVGGRKRCLACPFCNPVLHRPQYGIVIELVLCHVPERTTCVLRFRRFCGAP